MGTSESAAWIPFTTWCPVGTSEESAAWVLVTAWCPVGASESAAWVLVTAWCAEPGLGGELSITPEESVSSRQRFHDPGGSPSVLLPQDPCPGCHLGRPREPSCSAHASCPGTVTSRASDSSAIPRMGPQVIVTLKKDQFIPFILE